MTALWNRHCKRAGIKPVPLRVRVSRPPPPDPISRSRPVTDRDARSQCAFAETHDGCIAAFTTGQELARAVAGGILIMVAIGYDFVTASSAAHQSPLVPIRGCF